MPGRIRRHITYANVMATVAVFVALGGTSYAAVKLSRNSVKSTHIKNGQVKGPDVARNAIDANKIADGSLKLSDLSAPAVSGLKGAQGPGGPQGQAGEKGDRGDPGPAGTTITRLSGPGGQTATTNSFVPLSFNASFVQQADELAQFVGQATIKGSPGGDCLSEVRVSLGGVEQLRGGGLTPGGATVKFTLTATAAGAAEVPHFEPGAPTTRSFTAEASSLCGSGQRVTVDPIQIDVIRYR